MKFNTETKVTENTSSFEWTIKLPRAGNFQSPYLITSEEISLPSRDLTWSVSLTETLCHDGIRHFEAKFLLDKDFVDQSNSMCLMGITFNGKTSEMPSTEKNLKNGGYYINSAIEVPSDQESIILTPFCIYKELVSETKQVDEAEDFIDEEVLNQTEFDYLEDSLRMMNKSPEQRLNKTFRGEESFRDALDMTAGQVEEEAASIQQEEVWKALEIKTPSKTAVEKVEEVEEETRKHLFPSDEHALLAERIENIYLKKMRQVAETSSSLMVLASRVSSTKLVLQKHD